MYHVAGTFYLAVFTSTLADDTEHRQFSTLPFHTVRKEHSLGTPIIVH